MIIGTVQQKCNVGITIDHLQSISVFEYFSFRDTIRMKSFSTLQQKKMRRRRQIPIDNAFHHTYVMKLFDRSVDLAQFEEETPLYPICRAWMANQPRNPHLVPK